MKKGIKIVVVVVAVICALVVGMFVTADIFSKKTTANVDVQITDATGVADGVYEGSYTMDPVKASVQVTVEDEKITYIAILQHETGLGEKAESIVQDVIDQQSLEVDAISSATMSSKVILKAIENALEND